MDGAVMIRRMVLAAAAVVVLGAAGEPGVSVHDPWMRLLIRERPAAGYMTLENSTGAARILTGASSPACGSVMLHQSSDDGGVDRMTMVSAIPLPAHGAASLRPGGYHLMCMEPAATMVVGGTVPMKLEFADGGSLTVDMVVRGARGP
jgi:copper(I)-binding protein